MLFKSPPNLKRSFAGLVEWENGNSNGIFLLNHSSATSSERLNGMFNRMLKEHCEDAEATLFIFHTY